jgi:hypothetical protein
MNNTFKLEGIEVEFSAVQQEAGFPKVVKLGELSGSIDFAEGEYTEYLTFIMEFVQNGHKSFLEWAKVGALITSDQLLKNQTTGV